MGTFHIKEGNLVFTWNDKEVASNSDKAGEIRNRLLEVSGSGEPKKIQLRKPVLIPPLRISDKTVRRQFQMTGPIPPETQSRFRLVSRANGANEDFRPSDRSALVATLPRENLLIIASVGTQAGAYDLIVKFALRERSAIGLNTNGDVTLGNAEEWKRQREQWLKDCEEGPKKAEKDQNSGDRKKKPEDYRERLIRERDEIDKLIHELTSLRDGQCEVDVELFFKIGDDKIILARTKNDQGS